MLAATATVVLAVSAGHDAAAQGGCLGATPTIIGTLGDDTLVGTSGDDVIAALDGDDAVAGGDGSDLICLGGGVDVAQGGNGDDRIEGGTEDDLVVGDHLSSTEVGTGEDEVAGGDGHDVVIGDASNEVGSAAGEGDDAVNGGNGTDVVIGDAYSSSVAAGTGEDRINTGPGSDVVSGDVIVGDPTAAASRGGVADVEPGDRVGLGAGGDEVNTQTGEDLVVGDALTFEVSKASGRGLFAAPFYRLFCGRRLVSQALRKLALGMDPDEVRDFVEETLKAEFDGDFVLGDCANLRPLRSVEEIDEARRRRMVNGGGPDSILSGNEGPGMNTDFPGSRPVFDVVFGGSFGPSGVISNDNDSILLGKGDDLGFGDGGQPAFGANGIIAIKDKRFFLMAFDRIKPIPPTSDFNGDGVVDAADYTVWSKGFAAEMMEANAIPQSPRRGSAGDLPMDGGGKDSVRGGSGADQLDGGPKKDLCQGGGGEDDARGCEQETGVP